MSTVKLLEKKLKLQWPNVTVKESKKQQLYSWFCPQILSNEQLNWHKWCSDAIQANDVDSLKALVAADDAFCFRKRTENKSAPSPNSFRIVQVSGVDRMSLAELVAEQTYTPFLQNAATSQPDNLLVRNLADAKEKLKHALSCYVLYDQKTVAAVAIISPMSSLEASFVYPSEAKKTLQHGQRVLDCDGIVFLDVIFATNTGSGKRYGTHLLNRIENDHPRQLLVALSIPRRGTMYFYSKMNFTYGNCTRASCDNYLSLILERLDVATCAWHRGNPSLTLLHPETDARRPMISYIYDDDWEANDKSDVILFADEENQTLQTDDLYTMVKATAETYASSNMIWMTPLYNLSKTEFVKASDVLIEVASNVLSSNASVDSIVILTSSSNTRRRLLLESALKSWNVTNELLTPMSNSSFKSTPDASRLTNPETVRSPSSYSPYVAPPSVASPSSYSPYVPPPRTPLPPKNHMKYFLKENSEEFSPVRVKEVIRYYMLINNLLIQDISYKRYMKMYAKLGTSEPEQDERCIYMYDVETGIIHGVCRYVRRENRIHIKEVNEKSSIVFVFYIRIRWMRLSVEHGNLPSNISTWMDTSLPNLFKTAIPDGVLDDFSNVCVLEDAQLCQQDSSPTIASKKRPL